MNFPDMERLLRHAFPDKGRDQRNEGDGVQDTGDSPFKDVEWGENVTFSVNFKKFIPITRMKEIES